MRRTLALAIVLLAVPASASARGLHVAGNRLVNGAGRPVALHGVNRSGTEYACIQGWGIFDGPSDPASVRAMASWRINFVRVPLNEDCWLGINGVPSQDGAANYRRAIVRYVNLLHRYGMYVELSLIWAAPGNQQATYQPNAPDEDHSPAMWASLARTFRHDSRVILAPWGETTVSGSCFLRGCKHQATWGSNPGDGDGTCGGGCYYYTAAGMQQAVNVMRRAGYRGVISIPGLDYANDLSGWVAREPHDPRHQLIAEAHVYGKNTCDTVACLNRTMAPVARRVPLIFGEVGETYDASSCGHSYTQTFMSWADAHHVGYAAWTWDTWGNCEALIASYNGTPANDYGRWVRTHYTG